MATSPVLFVYYPPANDDAYPGVPGRHITEADWSGFTFAQRRTVENATTQVGYTRRKVWVHRDLVDETEEERAQREAEEAAARAAFDRANSLVRYGQIETMIDQLEVLPPVEEFAALRQDVDAVADVPPRVEAVEMAVERVAPSTYDRSPRWDGVAPGVLKNKTAYLDDRPDVDRTGADEMGATITAYLDEIRNVGNIGEVVSQAGATYRVGATPITVPRGLIWEGGGRLDVLGIAETSIVAAPGATKLINAPKNYGTIRGFRLDGMNQPGMVLIDADACNYLTLEHLHMHRVPAGGAAVKGGALLYFAMDYCMFRGSAGRGVDLLLSHYTGTPGPYYGVNVGQITRSFFYGSNEGFIRFDGILNVRDNDFEGTYTGTTGVIEVGGTANGHAIIESNYFEQSGTNANLSGVYLNAGASLVSIENNIMYGPSGNPSGMAAVRFGGAVGKASIVNNEFQRWETGVRDVFVSNGGIVSIEGNAYVNVGTEVTTNTNQRTNHVAGTDIGAGVIASPDRGWAYYGGSIQGSCVYYSDPATQNVVDLARGNVHEFAFTGPVNPTIANARPGMVFFCRFTNGNVTLSETRFHPIEGVTTVAAAGTSRMFYVTYSGSVVEVGR